jgi:hypothetical protein
VYVVPNSNSEDIECKSLCSHDIKVVNYGCCEIDHVRVLIRLKHNAELQFFIDVDSTLFVNCRVGRCQGRDFNLEKINEFMVPQSQ